MSVIVANKKEQTDGVMHRVCELIPSELPIVLMSKTNGFKFNDSLNGIKDYILVEGSELGWDWKWNENGSHQWGVNIDKFHQFSENEHYKRFNDWVAANPPKLTFQRELLAKDVSHDTFPIDYPCWYEPKEIQTKAQFNGRPIDAMYFWGRSHEARLRLHANIWLAASQKGFSVCDNINYFDKFVMEEDSKKWVSLWMPHYGRIDIREILGRQQLSKTSIAMPGAGIKTFRHCESSVNSVMVKWKDNMAWSYEWDETNCILTEEGKEIEDIEAAIQNPNLYQIYLNGVANCQKYSIGNYINNYINPIINSI
jgi:hypothetical protein